MGNTSRNSASKQHPVVRKALKAASHSRGKISQTPRKRLLILVLLGIVILISVGIILFVATKENTKSIPTVESAALMGLYYAGNSYQVRNAIPAGNENSFSYAVATTLREILAGYENPHTARIYLTFDDGPGRDSTVRVLDILRSYRVKATFFVLGNMVSKNPDILRQIDKDGHLIANHTYSHDYGKVYASSKTFIEELEQTDKLIAEVIGKSPVRIMRFPSGSTAAAMEADPRIREEITTYFNAGGWRYFDWNASLQDSLTEAPEPGSLAKNLNESIDSLVASGEKDIIVLAHDIDGKPWTPDDLPLVLDHCIRKGYAFKVLNVNSPVCAFR